MLSVEVFEEFAKERLKDLIEKGENPVIIAGFIDHLGDASLYSCSRCGVPVFIRPWLLEAIIEHKWKVLCICCADSKDVKGQIAMDFAKIEDKYKGEKG